MDVNASLPFPIPGFHDPVSAGSHLLLGVPIFCLITGLLVWRTRHQPAYQIALIIYGFCNVLLFTFSGVYHLLDSGTPGRLMMQRLDHAAIFLMIAGPFTPAHVILFRGWQRWLPLVIVWVGAFLGVALKLFFFNDVSESIGLTLYLGLGWFGAVSGFFIGYRYGLYLFRPLLWGALAYTFGAVFDYLRWPELIPRVVGYHECFHVAVLVGALCHALFVWRIASGPPEIVRAEALPGEGLG